MAVQIIIRLFIRCKFKVDKFNFNRQTPLIWLLQILESFISSVLKSPYVQSCGRFYRNLALLIRAFSEQQVGILESIQLMVYGYKMSSSHNIMDVELELGLSIRQDYVIVYLG